MSPDIHRSTATLDALLDPALRKDLEDRLWRPIDMGAKLEVLRDDSQFLADPSKHPALFSDHGTVHVRDIATGLIALGEVSDGVLLPRRPVDRQHFVLACGVLMVYFHDIGMWDHTPVGRRIHAVYAAHVAFSPTVDDVVERIVDGDSPVVERLTAVDRVAPFGTPLAVVVRELVSLAMAHSKSTVPASVLDDRAALRRLMQRAVFTDLAVHRASERALTTDEAESTPFMVNHDRYPDPRRSFAWLDAGSGPHAELADDVIDAIRLVRAADALRQRGTDLRTSGGYEICIDAASGRAVFTLRSADGDEAYLLSYHDDKAAGEANIKVATITPSGHLRVALHRGSFHAADAARRAAGSCAWVIADIAADVLPSFDTGTMRVELERPSDSPAFADAVIEALLAERPELAGRVVAVADVESADAAERDRYHRAKPLGADDSGARELLRQMADHGANVGAVDVDVAFTDVRVAAVSPGEVVMALGSRPSFVYVPAGPGLTVHPGGGYERRPLRPWLPVGTTGVVRRAERNADVIAEQCVDVIMIPAERYAAAWFRPYEPDELPAALARRGPATAVG